MRMQVASTEAEKENMAPEDINIQVNKDMKQTSREIQLKQTQLAVGNTFESIPVAFYMINTDFLECF